MSTAASAVEPPNSYLAGPVGDDEIITEKAQDKRIQTVVFVGDTMTSREKRNPRFRLGGKLYDLRTFPVIPFGMVLSCAITRLKPAMRDIHKDMVHPDSIKLYAQDYRIPNGHWNHETGQYEDLVCGLPGTSTADFVFKKITPIQMIGDIVRPQNGVVVIEEGINSRKDIETAQLHYFPNWFKILTGEDRLPATQRQLVDHLQERQSQARGIGLRAVGDAFLASAAQYRDWGLGYIAYQTAAIKETEKFPGAVRYDEIAERLFGYLEVAREDKLVQNFAQDKNDQKEAVATMADAVTKLATIMAGNQLGMQTMHELLAKAIAEKEQPAPVAADFASVPPAPVTVEEAKQEFSIAASDGLEENFNDMSAATSPVLGDEIVDAMLAEAGADEDDEIQATPAGSDDEDDEDAIEEDIEE